MASEVILVGPAGYVSMPREKERTLLATGRYQSPADFLAAQKKASDEAHVVGQTVTTDPQDSDPDPVEIVEPQEE